MIKLILLVVLLSGCSFYKANTISVIKVRDGVYNPLQCKHETPPKGHITPKKESKNERK